LDWEHVRISVLEEQKKAIDREMRIANIEKLKKELQEREQLLTFFDRKNEIELEIEKITERERKEMQRIRAIPKSAKKLRKLVAAETYVPLDITKNKIR
jgi:hypothetical protein